jgi:RNA polymerase sigma factor (sigma-70 family)
MFCVCICLDFPIHPLIRTLPLPTTNTTQPAKSNSVVRLPVHVHDLLNQIGRAERELSAQLGRQPTEAEIAARVDIPQRKLQFLRERTQHTLSMDATRPASGRKSGSGIGDEVRVSDSISDSEPLQDVKADEAYLREQVERLLESLNPREADVVKMRYGLIDGQQRTLEEIGVAFRVTRERVRQIEARALHKIKQPYRAHQLRGDVAGRSLVHGNDAMAAVLGDFAGASDPAAAASAAALFGLEEEAPLAPASRRGKRGKTGAGAAGANEPQLVGAGTGRRGRRPKASAALGAAAVMGLASHNETLSSFP